MYCMDAPLGGFVYPDDGHNILKKYKLAGKGTQYPDNEGGLISVIPFQVPQNSEDWNSFATAMKLSEERLATSIL